MNEVLLKDIHKIKDWEFTQISEGIRFYYKLKESWFDFYVVERTWYTVWFSDWQEEETIVECIINWIAYFDWVRHLYYWDEKTDNEWYHYYPDLNDIILSLEELITAREFNNRVFTSTIWWLNEK